MISALVQKGKRNIVLFPVHVGIHPLKTGINPTNHTLISIMSVYPELRELVYDCVGIDNYHAQHVKTVLLNGCELEVWRVPIRPLYGHLVSTGAEAFELTKTLKETDGFDSIYTPAIVHGGTAYGVDYGTGYPLYRMVRLVPSQFCKPSKEILLDGLLHMQRITDENTHIMFSFLDMFKYTHPSTLIRFLQENGVSSKVTLIKGSLL